MDGKQNMVREGKRKRGLPSARRKRMLNRYYKKWKKYRARKKARARKAAKAGKTDASESRGESFNTINGGEDCVSNSVKIPSDGDHTNGLSLGDRYKTRAAIATSIAAVVDASVVEDA